MTKFHKTSFFAFFGLQIRKKPIRGRDEVTKLENNKISVHDLKVLFVVLGTWKKVIIRISWTNNDEISQNQFFAFFGLKILTKPI